jgi:hypothetical protein
MRLRQFVAVLAVCSCGGSSSEPARSAAPGSAAPGEARSSRATSGNAESAANVAVGAHAGGGGASEDADPAFETKFESREPGYPWNPFGVRGAERQVYGGPEGLWLKVARAEKAWDAVGIRTARIEIDGDFDLRGGFGDFGAPGNASAKLLVVDAKGRPGDSAFVERIQIDGKNLLKFGGEVDGSAENWGFTPTELVAGELRLVRRGATLHGYARADNSEMWAEIGRGQAAPRSLPSLVKFGLRLSAEAQKSAQVRWLWLTMRGALVKRD